MKRWKKVLISILFINMVLIIPQVYGGGVPHSVFGRIYNSDGMTSPSMAQLSMSAYIDYSPAPTVGGVSETRNYNQSTPDVAVKYGTQTIGLPWYEVECANFLSGTWEPNDILHLDITNTGNGEHKHVQIVLVVTEPQYESDISLPVQMTTIVAAPTEDAGVMLTWRTESETDCVGFHVWRSEEEEGEYVRITTELISGSGNKSSATEYTYQDRNVEGKVTYWYKIEEISMDGRSILYGPVSVGITVSVPTQYGLSQNYPNPFNPETSFDYQLPEVSDVTIEIYSILGQKIKTWTYDNQSAGYFTVSWNGTDELGKRVSSGIYFLQMKAGNYREMRKMTIMH